MGYLGKGNAVKQRLLALFAVISLFGVLATPASAGVAGSTNVEIGYNAVPSWNGRTIEVEVTITCGVNAQGYLYVYVAQETRNRTVEGWSDSYIFYQCGDVNTGGGSTTLTVEVRADGGKWRWVKGEAEATVRDTFSNSVLASDTILIGR